MTSIPDWLAQRARITPLRVALVCGDERISFATLDGAAGRVAGGLAEQGAARGDRVALLAHNGISFVRVVHGAARLGALLVPLNTRLAVDEMVWQVADSGANLLVYDPGHAERAGALASARPGLRVVPIEALDSTPFPAGSFDLAASQTITYTSGTTGRPKGAILTYGNHWWSAVGSALNLGLYADDAWLACLPLFHVGGLAILVRSVVYGISTIVHRSFDPAAVNRAIDDDGVTIVSLVATMLQRVLEQRGARPTPRTLRCVLLGGGPAPRPLLEVCAERGVPVVQTYGLTEAASQVATLSPEDALSRLGSAGKPLMPTEMRIDPDGEIVIRGPSVSPGYWGAPARLAGEWLRTGDVGRLDDDGYLYVLDRREDLIVSGGENVYPAEVEAALIAHPAVLEAGVTGVDDPVWGRVPSAAVVLVAGQRVSADDLRAHCRERLAAYKVPASIAFVERLPRNAAGKLLRRQIGPSLRGFP